MMTFEAQIKIKSRDSIVEKPQKTDWPDFSF